MDEQVTAAEAIKPLLGIMDRVDGVEWLLCELRDRDLLVVIRTEAGMGYTGRVVKVCHDFIIFDDAFKRTVAVPIAKIAEICLTPDQVGR